jgi:tetratricopeptide (TPR) repeat protein
MQWLRQLKWETVLMKKNKKILLKIVLTASLSLQIATASVLADPVIIGVDVLPDAVAKNQTDLHQQFQKLVSQKNYVDALAVLHTQCQGDSLFMIKEIFQLPDHELSRKIMNLLIDTKMPNSKQMDSLHSYAVTLARNENFVDSLQLLRWLYQNAADDQTIIYDYIVVLNWAGNNDEAVDVFEKVNLVNPPQYVLNSVAGAYYRLQKYQTALIYAQEAAAQENPPSLILLAQINYGLGNYKKGNEIYNRLLKANPKDLELLRNRASVEMQTKQYEDALDDFNQVELLSADLPNAQDIKRSLDHDMAVAYIRENDEPQAILLLRPYIEAGTTDVFIQSDYILALRNYRDYKTAIQAGTRLWLDWKKIPIFGLQALGDCYLYSGDMDKALQIYSSILTRSPNLNGAKEGKAFVYMMTGKLDKGCALYDSLIITDTAVADVVLNDAYYFYKQGIFEASNRLYALLVKHFPSNAVYRDAYAKSLSTNNMYRDIISIKDCPVFGVLNLTAY